MVITTISQETAIQISSWIGKIFDPFILVVVALIISAIFYSKKSKKQGILLATTTLITGGLILILKEIIQRPRPTFSLIQETGFAFPSGHATMATVFFGIIAYMILVKVKHPVTKILTMFSAISIITIISLTRIYLGVHWFSDVVAGIILGGAIAITSISIYRKK